MKKQKPKRRTRSLGECTIPPPINLTAIPDFVFGRPKHEERRVRDYMKWQAGDEKVIHLERVGSESLMGRTMGFWDVHTNKRKWWVITNPTNLYAQDLFPSLDYTVSFHVGVTTRMFVRDRSYGGNVRLQRITPTLKRLEAVGTALDEADEAEKFQAIGMALRECLLLLIRELFRPEYVTDGVEAPKVGDFIHRAELVANATAAGRGAEETRGYLKAVSKTTWQLVNHLTHASNAVRQDASLAYQAVESLVAAFWQVAEKHESGVPERCPSCGSYRVTQDYRPDLGIDPPYIKLCERCDWVSPTQVPPAAARAANKASRLARHIH